MSKIARCGCSGSSCNCLVTPGPGISVSGTGSALNPYVVEGDFVDQIRLRDLSDYDKEVPANGQVLGFDTGLNKWRPYPPATSTPGAINVGQTLLGDGSSGAPLYSNPRVAQLWSADGAVADEDNELGVSAGTGLNSVVAPGRGWCGGAYFINASNTTLNHGPAPTGTGVSRVDLVIMELTRATGAVTLKVIKGSPSSVSPLPPTLQRDRGTGLWQVPLASVVLAASATALGTITDERTVLDSNVSPQPRKETAGAVTSSSALNPAASATMLAGSLYVLTPTLIELEAAVQLAVGTTSLAVGGFVTLFINGQPKRSLRWHNYSRPNQSWTLSGSGKLLVRTQGVVNWTVTVSNDPGSGAGVVLDHATSIVREWR